MTEVTSAKRPARALTSQFIIVLLGSSVVSQISATNLTFAGAFIQSRAFRSFEVYLVVTAIYLCLAAGFRRVLHVTGARTLIRN